MSKVILVNPANATIGYSIITPRWLYVIAGATPIEFAGDPVIIDEPIKAFDAEKVGPGDIVGVGIHTANCRPGYRVVQAAKKRGATVIVGGVHGTIFPEEPLEMGADAVVKGNADLIWKDILEDAHLGKLQRVYDGGRVPGELMVKARWDLLDPNKYLMGCIQTVAGCPENCSFCSVWVTDGRTPRLHLNQQIIDEANELHDMGFRYVFFSDDNFTPATLARIARETNPQTRANLERVREDRLRLFAEYDKAGPPTLYAFTQMTAECNSDDEYMDAMYQKMRLRGALIGVESFTEAGLKNVNKTWNPVGHKMAEAIQKIQSHGIMVLASIIGGLESDTRSTFETMRHFANVSGTAFAQFPLYSVYPGTKDYHEMIRDWKNRDNPDYKPKHAVQILRDKFWLDYDHSDVALKHPSISTEELMRESQESATSFYSLKEILARTRSGAMSNLPLLAKIFYAVTCRVFASLYPGGVAADNVRKTRLGIIPKLSMRAAMRVARRDYDWGIRPQRREVIEEIIDMAA
jgi:radical SAM superfamily enzyme YgiQ (UPF0313 family)